LVDFRQFYDAEESPEITVVPSWIISASNIHKFHWDIYITVLLLVVCTVVPIHIVFQFESSFWCGFFFFIDSMFLVDIGLSFFTSIPETENEEECNDKKMIANKYLSEWFVIDAMSIFPFHVIFESYHEYSLW
jgi:potassium voltage-gated channel Eag-related subfamily H protein 7